MKLSRTLITSIASLALAMSSLLLGGCGNSGGGTAAAGGGGGTTVSGTAVAGPLDGSTVKIYAVNSDCTDGALIGSGNTNPDGTFSVTLSAALPSAYRIEISGGTYTSEADGSTVTNGTTFSSLVTGSTTSGLAVTPLTEMSYERAKTTCAADGVAKAHADADALIESTYGLTSAPGTLLPTFSKSTIGSDSFLSGFILGALETCAAKYSSASYTDWLHAIADDWSDGVLDGKYDGGKPVPLGSGTLASTAGTTDFLACVSAYGSAPAGSIISGIASTDLAGTVSTIKTAVTSSSAVPTSLGLEASSSGAISTLAFGGKQWLFIAAHSAGVVAIDITDPTATSPTTKVWPLTTDFPSGVGGVVPMLGADHPQLLVYAYNSKHVALINASDGTVDWSGDLPIAATSTVQFSGGSAYIAGAIPDTARDGAWLATADGYYFFDRATHSLGTLYTIDTTQGQELAENLGGDISHDLLFAPNYAPGVQLVDLAAGKSYYMSNFSTTFPALYEPDGGSVDSGYQVGIITNEDTPDVGFVNLATIVKTSDPTGGDYNTFAPGTGGTASLSLTGSSGNYLAISGSAVDSATHLALFMAGYSNDIAVGQLQDPASATPSNPWTGLSDWRYYTLPNYTYATDPHAVAVVRNLSDGKDYGYLLDGSYTDALQIDMSAFLALAPNATGGHQLTDSGTTIKTITW